MGMHRWLLCRMVCPESFLLYTTATYEMCTRQKQLINMRWECLKWRLDGKVGWEDSYSTPAWLMFGLDVVGRTLGWGKGRCSREDYRGNLTMEEKRDPLLASCSSPPRRWIHIVRQTKGWELHVCLRMHSSTLCFSSVLPHGMQAVWETQAPLGHMELGH